MTQTSTLHQKYLIHPDFLDRALTLCLWRLDLGAGSPLSRKLRR
jgi:hypothetical protein